MEKYLDNLAEPAHDEMKRKLKTYDAKTTSYHQVSFLGTKCTALFLITRSLTYSLSYSLSLILANLN